MVHQRKFFREWQEVYRGNFHKMCERFNIKIQTTPAFSSWGNGVCERHNQTLTTILLKTKDDIKCDFETALAWVVSVKNYLMDLVQQACFWSKSKFTKLYPKHITSSGSYYKIYQYRITPDITYCQKSFQ